MTERIPNQVSSARLKHAVSLAFGVLILTIAALQQKSPTIQKLDPGLYQVIRVDDGDTIKVQDSLGSKETVRFIGIDTPEVKDPRKAVQCFGEQASLYTHSLLDGQKVRLVADVASGNRDKYQRLLRYVYLPDGTFVNAKLVADGYAFAYIVFPNSQTDNFVRLQREAREQNKGLWQACTINESQKIKQTNAL